MKTIPRPAKQVRTPIRFVGGPLNRKTGTALYKPCHRDGEGLPIPEHAAVARIHATRQLGSIATLYFLDLDQATYQWLPDWVLENRNQQIKRLLELAAEQPDKADEIEAAIRAIESGPA